MELFNLPLKNTHCLQQLVTSLGVPSKPAMWYFPAGPQLTGEETEKG